MKVQLDTAERLQQSQSARDIYRGFLTLSVTHPEYAEPDFCAISDGPNLPAYEAFVEYMLYTAEQVVAMDVEWGPVFENAFAAHAPYFCADADWSGYTEDVAALITRLRATACPAPVTC